MQNKKTLKLLMIIIILAIIGIFVLLVTLNKDNSDEIYEVTENVGPVSNQGAEVLEYNNKIYFVNNDNQSIIQYDKDNGVYQTVVNANQNEFGNRIFIQCNKLIYTNNSKTYTSDLNTFEINEILNGKILYVDDNIYIYTMKVGSLDYLYLSSYDEKTLYRTNKVSYALATGNNIDIMKKCGDMLLFTSENTDGSSSLFSVDTTKSTVSLLAQTDTSEESGYISKFIDATVLSEKNEVYYIVSESSKGASTNEENVENKTLYYSSIEYGYKEIRDFVVNNRVVNMNDEVIYQSYNSDSGDFRWTNGIDVYDEKDVIELLDGDITEYVTTDNQAIYLLDNKIMNIDANFELSKILHYGDSYYILLKNGSNGRWYTCNTDGSNLLRIYEWR